VIKDCKNVISSIVWYLSGFAKLIYFNMKICLEQFEGFKVFPFAVVTFWHVWYNFLIRWEDFDSLLQCKVTSLHFSVFYNSLIAAYNKIDLPQPYFPTIMISWLFFNHVVTIYTSFFISFVRYILLIPVSHSSWYYPILPSFYLKLKGSRSPGTFFP